MHASLRLASSARRDREGFKSFNHDFERAWVADQIQKANGVAQCPGMILLADPAAWAPTQGLTRMSRCVRRNDAASRPPSVPSAVAAPRPNSARLGRRAKRA